MHYSTRSKFRILIFSSKNFNDINWVTSKKIPNIGEFELKHKNDLNLYARRIRELAQKIRNLGSKPIFVTQAKASYRIKNGEIFGEAKADGTPNLEEYIGLKAINTATLKVCKSIFAICIDLAGKLHFEDGDHYDSVHTSPSGSKKIGKFLYDELKTKILQQ